MFAANFMFVLSLLYVFFYFETNQINFSEVKAEFIEDKYVERESVCVRKREWYWKEKSISFILSWGLGFLLVIVVWCACPLRYPRNGQSKDRVQVISYLIESELIILWFGSWCPMWDEIEMKFFFSSMQQSSM